MLEYALILGVAAAMSIGFTLAFGGAIQKGFTKFNAILEKELSTGSFREKLQIWEN